MRENRTHGSEGGEGKSLPDPYQKNVKTTFYETIKNGVSEAQPLIEQNC